MTNKKDVKDIIKKEEIHLNNLLEQALVSIYGETFDPWNIGADCIKANFTNYHRYVSILLFLD